MDSCHEVHLVPARLREPEFYLEIAENLESIARGWDILMGEISSRVARQTQRLDSIQQRIDFVNSQIEQLRKLSTKAIVVHASSHYPSHLESQFECLRDELSTYARDLICRKNDFLSLANADLLQVSTSMRIADEAHQANIQQTHALHKQPGYTASSVAANQKRKTYGLYGAVVPEHDLLLSRNMCDSKIKSVSSLVLFNSERNLLYRSPKRRDEYLLPNVAPQGRGSAHRRATDMTSVINAGLHGPPASFLRRNFDYDAVNNVSDRQSDALAYVPGMGDVPTLQMPATLSGLENVAILDDDDDFFQPAVTIKNPARASPGTSTTLHDDRAQMMSQTASEPLVHSDRSRQTESHMRSSQKSVPQTSVNTSNALNGSTTSARMPLESAASKSISPASSPLQAASSAPPPPPPPPPPLPPIGALVVPSASTEATGNAHAQLMEAIRGTGGFGRIKLRPATASMAISAVKSDEHKQQNKLSKAAAPPQLDLLGELKKHLDLRRPAIAGSSSRALGSRSALAAAPDAATSFSTIESGRRPQLPILSGSRFPRAGLSRQSSSRPDNSDASDDADWTE